MNNLSDRRVFEYVIQGRQQLRNSKLKVYNGYVPYLKNESCLMLYPVLQRVCLWPIKEIEDEEGNEDVDDCDISSRYRHRPLFYYDLNSTRVNEMKRRKKQFKRG